tara:strand:- start:174 stop:434 length:261 start_codon:yes stop_codon:yes gene_type:complete
VLIPFGYYLSTSVKWLLTLITLCKIVNIDNIVISNKLISIILKFKTIEFWKNENINIPTVRVITRGALVIKPSLDSIPKLSALALL